MDQTASRRHRLRRPGIQAPASKSHHAKAPTHPFTRYQNVLSLQPPNRQTNDLHSSTLHPANNFPGNSSSSTSPRYYVNGMTTLSAIPGIPSSPSRERLHRRQRSHPFLNLTFTALHEPSTLSHPQPAPQSQPGPQPLPARGSSATGSSSNTGFGTSALVTGYNNEAPSQERKARRVGSSGSLPPLPNASTARRPARSLPSSPGPTRRPSLSHPTSSFDGLDPRKEYFFTPSSTPIVLPPTSPPDPMAPRMRKRSTGAKSAPTSPVCSLTPVGSKLDLVAYAEKTRLSRSGSIGEAMHALRNQQWVGPSTRTGASEFPAGGNFFATRPRYTPSETQYLSPDEETQDEAEAVSFSGRKKRSQTSTRSPSNTAGGALDITIDATPTLSRRQSDATLRAHSVQTTPPLELVVDAVPLPATASTDSEIDQRTLSILYALRYLAAIPVIQTAVSNLRLALLAKSSITQVDHGLVCLWAIATAVALVNLTTDLLRRWLYNCRYPPFPHILIRLLALQLGILFPSIHLGHAILNPNPVNGVFRQAVVPWCFLATAITMAGEAIRPWTLVATHKADSGQDELLGEKHTEPVFATDEQPRPIQDPLHYQTSRLQRSVGNPLFLTAFAYVITSWALLLTEGSS